MKIRKRRLIKYSGALAVLLAALLLFFFWSAGQLLNLDKTKGYITSYIRSRLGGSFTYETLEIKLFPRPHAEVIAGRVRIAHKMNLTWKSLRLRPELSALVFGNLIITDLELVQPHFTFRIGDEPRQTAADQHESVLPPVSEKIRNALLAAMGFASKLVVSDGDLSIHYRSGKAYRFQSLQLTLRSSGQHLRLAATCRPDWIRHLMVSAEIDPQAYSGSARLQFNRARIDKFLSAWSPDPSWRLSPSRLNGTIDLRIAGPGQWQADVKGSSPEIVLSRGVDRQRLFGTRLNASVHHDQHRTALIVHDFQVANPELQLRGRLDREIEPSRVSFDFTGSTPRLAPVRSALLRLLDRHKVLRVVFGIVRGGQIPEIHFKSSGRNWRETGKGSHLHIFGKVRGARVYVPHVAIEVTKVNGRFDVTRKILTVSEATLRWKESTGFVKRLTLDLDKKTGPFHLDVSLDTDLPQLPSLLARLIHNRIFAREMGNIDEIEGRAKGRLVIRGSLQRPRVEVDIASFYLKGRYRRIPYPLRVSRGRFHYRYRRVVIEEVNGSCGKTDFEGLRATLDWRNGYRLITRGRRTRVCIDQIYPWVLSYPVIRTALKRFPQMNGTALVSHFSMSGPLLHPKRWKFRVAGHLEYYRCDSTLFPAPLAVQNAQFQATEKDLSFTHADLELMRSKGTGSGKISDYLKGVTRLELSLDGEIRKKTARWLHGLFQLPDEFRMKTPFAVKFMKVAWEPRRRIRLNGRIVMPARVRLDLAVTSTAKVLSIDRLAIRDKDSDCDLKISHSGGKWAVLFKGVLRADSLDRILVVNRFLKGALEGDIALQVPAHHWTMLTAQGTLRGSGLKNPGSLLVENSWPLKLDSIRLEASNNRIDIVAASLHWDRRRYTLAGQVFLSEGKALFDLDLHATDLSWSWIKRQLDLEKARSTRTTAATHGLFPSYRGVVRLQADRFHYGRLTFEPFHADVTLGGDKGIAISITKATYCGISVPTEIQVYPNNRLQIVIRAGAKGLDLDKALTCIWNKPNLMSGTFDFSGQFNPSGNPGEEFSSIEGRADFAARSGRIYRFNLLSKIFALLNVSEIFRGKLPDLAKEGFAYNTFTLKGPIEEGRFVMEEGYIDGASMDIAWQGECDLGKKTLDMTVLVAPFKTVDSVLKHIPVLGKLMNGSTVAIPIKVTGPVDNPDVLPLGPSAVGSSIFRMIERILRLPNTIIQPLLKKP